MQNVYIDGSDIFNKLRTIYTIKDFWVLNGSNYDNLMFFPVTYRTRDVYSQLPTLSTRKPMHVKFNFKTEEPNGIILFNKGNGQKFIAVELVNGKLRFAFNNGYKTSDNLLPMKVDDNNWHTFEIKEIPNANQYEIRLGPTFIRRIPIVESATLDLSGPLFIGGLSANMLKDNGVRNVLQSDVGFVGCIASVDLNGVVYDLTTSASNTDFVQTGCVGTYIFNHSVIFTVQINVILTDELVKQ